MSDYIQLNFGGVSAEQAAILIAQLSEVGFEGFEETGDQLRAFIPSENFDPSAVTPIAEAMDVSFSKDMVADRNWNLVWESNFEPVVADDFVAIRAEFHPAAAGVEHEIIITPKMSFGTGHHATTFMMVREMRHIGFKDKRVLDFGTGTGILAILAEKLGASDVLAIDNDDWSIRNAAENIWRNNCSQIRLEKADTATKGHFDVILANINKNVIMDNFAVLAASLNTGGILLLSGLLPEDEHDVFRRKNEYSLQILSAAIRANWLCIKMSC